jgi:hypothetical protein
MNIDNIAFLIPIHPPHYHFMYNLINKLKYNNIKIDIYLVFSNNTDYSIFTMKNEIHPIMCEYLQTKSIVTYKKFIGLKYLAYSKYDYIICCDSEIDIISSNFTTEIINNKIKQIFDNKKIYGGTTNDEGIKNILRLSSTFFLEKYKYLEDITENFTLYFWWSDLPVYRRTDINQFLNIIKYDNLVWEHFDYIIYQYYLILYHGFEIINITYIINLKWSLEYLFTDNIDLLNKLININYGFSWNSKSFYNLNKNFVESQKGFLIYHLDRDLNNLKFLSK